MDEEELEEMIDKIAELINDKKITQLHNYIEEINSAEFPYIFEGLKDEKIMMLYRLLSKEKAAEVFVELDSDDQEMLINLLTDKEIKNVMNEINMDDAADLIEEMPATVVKKILANTKAEDRKVINELLKYPEDTAGTIMTTEFIDLKENMTVEDAFKRIKNKGLKSETVYNCYVLTADRKLIGIVDIKALLVTDRSKLVKEIMETNVIQAQTIDDKESIAKLFEKYNIVAVPIVDKENRLVGIVTIDDAIDVIQDEASEDFEKMAAMAPIDDNYFKTGVFTHAKNRIMWLIILMFSAIITGSIIENFENAISSLPLLVSFIPMLMDTGGNAGSQASTLIIRGLATDEITTKDVFKALWKEFRVAVLVGLVLAFVNTLRVVLFYHDLKCALVVSATVFCIVIVAKIIGCILPMIAKKIHIDPAIMASPILTTISDTCAVFIFFSIVTNVYHI